VTFLVVINLFHLRIIEPDFKNPIGAVVTKTFEIKEIADQFVNANRRVSLEEKDF
jgi:hypothetical protein